jgi:hypothetical protein
MSHRRSVRAFAGVLVIALALVGASSAGAASKIKQNKTSSKVTLSALGNAKYKVNGYVTDASHWSYDVVNIKSGGTLTVKGKNPAPHSFSLIKTEPRGISQIFECPMCGPYFAAHQLSDSGVPGKPVVDVDGKGFNQVGDSLVIAPKKSTSVKITAPKGTSLKFVCIFHPWMQGKVKVK